MVFPRFRPTAMTLATCIDNIYSKKWYENFLRKQLRLENYESVSDWHCFLLLYETEEEIALAVDKLSPLARRPVCLFILLFRALQAMACDKSISAILRMEILRELPRFFKDPTLLSRQSSDRKDSMGDSLWHFDLLVSEFYHLQESFGKILLDGISRAADGFYSVIKIGDSCESTLEFNLKCHYNGGLLWIIILRIISGLQLEPVYLSNEEHLCNAVGVFVTKVDLINRFRDNDLLSTIPKDIWGIYTEGDLTDLYIHANRHQKLFCLNHLVLDALRHVPDIISLLSRLEDLSVFRLVALRFLISMQLIENSFSTFDKSQNSGMHLLYKDIWCLTDLQRMLQGSLISIRRHVKLTDPTSGQLLLLLDHLELACSRTRNRSLLLRPWALSLGAMIEMAIVGLIGAFLVEFFR